MAINPAMLNNYTDEELCRYADRGNPEVEELCQRLEERSDKLRRYEAIVEDLEKAEWELAQHQAKHDAEAAA